jgi:hypothetical protein
VKYERQSETPSIGHALLNYLLNNCKLVLTSTLKKVKHHPSGHLNKCNPIETCKIHGDKQKVI